MIKLDVDKILSILNEVSLTHLSKMEIFESISSTNTYLLESAKIKGQVCFAEEQSQGRGRLGRAWYSPRGYNLYFSMTWEFSHSDISSLSLAVAVIIGNVLQKYGISHITLKWPNDVLYFGRKLSGILLERSGSIVVIGIGLNIFLPEELPNQAIGLMEMRKQSVDRNFLAGLLVNELLCQLPVYAEKGFNAFLDDWRKRDALFGKKISIQNSEDIVFGEMLGINEVGELLLKNEKNQIHTFRCGEVSVC